MDVSCVEKAMSSMHRPVAKLAIVMTLLGALRLSTASASAQSLSDLFQQMKSEVNARSWDAALRTMATLQTEAAEPGNEATREKLEAPIAFYRGVCEANLGQRDEAVADFATFLKMQPNASIDSTIHSKEAVAAFEQARKAVVDRAPSLAEAYASFAADATAADLADKFWADGPVRWILTDQEKREWAGLTDPNLRIAFVERFWAERAELPGAGSRRYRQEFERRVAFADAYLGHDGAERGSLTDRGMVFILLGPPRAASRKSLRSEEDPSEPSGMSRVETQEAKLAMKGPSKGATASVTGAKVSLWARYQGPEHRALSTDDEFLEVWQYGLEQLPRGVPYPKVDVHYVTRRGSGMNVLQPSTASRHALDAAKRQAAPQPH